MLSEATVTSRRSFFLCCAAIVVCVLAFPIYQALDTGGHVFYTNGIDEAAYLSYPYVKVLGQWRGLCRYSSLFVRALHEAGLSGGWINVLFDTIGTVTILLVLPIAYSRCLGLDPTSGRRCALITFVVPLLVTPFNPLVALLVDLRSSSSLFAFSALPPNPENIFLRSPEPQISLLIVCILCAAIGRRHALAWASVCLAPFLYTFVRVPVLFLAVTSLAPKQLSLCVRLGLGFLVVAVTSMLFFRFGVDPTLQRLYVESDLPVVSLTAVVSTGLWLSLRQVIPDYLSAVVITLVTSTWIAPNLQLISGAMVSPTKYEEYWGAVVVAVLVALLVQYRSRRPDLWIVLLLTVFVVWAAENFTSNRYVYAKLSAPREAIRILKQAPGRVASSDLQLSVYLDMVYPRQEHTLFSFTKTYTLSSEQNYHEYRCARDFVESLPPEESGLFQEQFRWLDYGYVHRGIDEVITMRRRPLEESQFKNDLRSFSCSKEYPILIDVVRRP